MWVSNFDIVECDEIRATTSTVTTQTIQDLTATGNTVIGNSATDTLNVTGVATINGKVILSSTETIAAWWTTTALDLTKYAHNIDADAGGDIFTLADGVDWQEVFIFMKSATGTATITPATKTGFTSVTFNAAWDSVVLKFVTTLGWIIAGWNSYAVS